MLITGAIRVTRLNLLGLSHCIIAAMRFEDMCYKKKVETGEQKKLNFVKAPTWKLRNFTTQLFGHLIASQLADIQFQPAHFVNANNTKLEEWDFHDQAQRVYEQFLKGLIRQIKWDLESDLKY